MFKRYRKASQSPIPSWATNQQVLIIFFCAFKNKGEGAPAISDLVQRENNGTGYWIVNMSDSCFGRQQYVIYCSQLRATPSADCNIIIIIIIKAYTALIQTVLSALQFINSIKYNKNINIQINIQSYGLNKKKKTKKKNKKKKQKKKNKKKTKKKNKKKNKQTNKQTNKLTKDYMLIWLYAISHIAAGLSN